MLGLTYEFKPRFLRQYADLYDVVTKAVSQYIDDVKKVDFPNSKEAY
jgi:3-methyl-2-oxobutanoate hydroxymethyltransferase